MRIQTQAETFALRLGMPWYHMSPHQLEPGTKLVPRGGPTSWQSYYDQSGQGDRQNHVWLEDDPDLADDWGRMLTKGQQTKANPYPYHVYQVEPHGEPQSEGSTSDLKQREGWRAPEATVTREVPRSELLRRYHPTTGEPL